MYSGSVPTYLRRVAPMSGLTAAAPICLSIPDPSVQKVRAGHSTKRRSRSMRAESSAFAMTANGRDSHGAYKQGFLSSRLAIDFPVQASILEI